MVKYHQPYTPAVKQAEFLIQHSKGEHTPYRMVERTHTIWVLAERFRGGLVLNWMLSEIGNNSATGNLVGIVVTLIYLCLGKIIKQPFFFILKKLVKYAHNIKFTILSILSVQFSGIKFIPFIMLCDHHHHPYPQLFLGYNTETLHPLSSNFLFPSFCGYSTPDSMRSFILSCSPNNLYEAGVL